MIFTSSKIYHTIFVIIFHIAVFIAVTFYSDIGWVQGRAEFFSIIYAVVAFVLAALFMIFKIISNEGVNYFSLLSNNVQEDFCDIHLNYRNNQVMCIVLAALSIYYGNVVNNPTLLLSYLVIAFSQWIVVYNVNNIVVGKK